MKKLILATNNAGKVREIKAIFTGLYDEVKSLKDEGIKADVIEDGKTFLENAAKKAREISLLTDCDVMADDSGLCVDGLDGAPGVYSARYSGEGTDEANRAALIKAVLKIDEKDRTARFVCAMAVARAGKVIFSCEAASDTGKIISEERGENGFGYDPIFLVKAAGRSMAELSAEEKNNISHRAVALRRFLEELRDYNAAHQ